MTPEDQRDFVSVLDQIGEAEIRRHLEVGHYRGKKWEERLPVIRKWLDRQAWQRVAWLN